MPASQKTDSSNPTADGVFDVSRSLLPASFKARTDSPPTIAVCPIPEDLEKYLQVNSNGTDTNWTEDLRHLLSYHHLSYLYSRFLSPNGLQVDSNKEHPLWSELADGLGSSPNLDCLRDGWTPVDGHPLTGLSTVFCDYRVELATNFKVIWEGSVYHKSLDFLLRFALRFDLAPCREARYFERVRSLAAKKLLDKEAARTERIVTHKAWTDRTEILQDILGKLMATGKGRDEIHRVLARLVEQAACEPGTGLGQSEINTISSPNGSSKRHDNVMTAMAMMEATDEAMDDIDKEAEQDEEQRVAVEGKKKK